MQTDCGTENGIMTGVHCALHQNVQAHRYGKSIANQRIENLWSHYRRGYSNWVINFFKELVSDGFLALGKHEHMECAWFVFSPLLQLELDQVRQRWNTHYIRQSHDHVIGGVPDGDGMFFLPDSYNFQDCGKEVTENSINAVLQRRDIESEAREVAFSVDEGRATQIFLVCC